MPQGHGYCFTHIFFHPDFNRWSRSFTESAGTLLCPVADYTASGEFHPALKTFNSVVHLHYIIVPLYCKRFFLVLLFLLFRVNSAGTCNSPRFRLS